MLNIVLFKNTGDPNSCGWETCRVGGNIKYSWLRMPKGLEKNSSYFVSSTSSCCSWCLLLLTRVPARRFGINTAEGVLLPSALALAATVFVPSVPTGVTTGHVGCLVATGAVLLTVAKDPKRAGDNRSGPRQGSLPIFSANFLNRQSSVR